MFDFLFRNIAPKYTVCRIALSDALNFEIENKVIFEILRYLEYVVPIVDKCEIIDEYNARDRFETKISSVTSPIIEYVDDNGKKEIFSGFYSIIRFLGRLTHLFPSNISNAAQIDTMIEFHPTFMNLYFHNPASITLCLKNLMADVDVEHPFLSSMDSSSIADILWAITMREISIVSRPQRLVEKIKFYIQTILLDDYEELTESHIHEDERDCGDHEDDDKDDDEDDSDDWMEPTL